MLNIAIDLGSYSIKILTFTVDKKRVNYINSNEIILDKDQFDIMEEHALLDLQLKQITEFLSEQDQEYNLILNTPTDMLTSRILDLPVNNRKKANLMLPFQLETDLPYSLSECHYASSLEIGKQSSSALISITKTEEFDSLYSKLRLENISPKILTTDISSYSNFISNFQESLPQSFCILDIGHSNAKAYFFIGNKLVSNHLSHIAGHSFDEAISETYHISREEASIYKHQNAFFLLEDQLDSVSDDQKVFAQMMDRTAASLVQDFKRWMIGFKVKFADDLTNIYVTGGSSNIRNINSYLTEKLSIDVSNIDTFSQADTDNIDKDIRFRNKFANSNVIAQSFLKKSKLINLLTGKYSLAEQVNLPVDKFIFVGVRVAVICLILLVSLTVERFLINSEIKAMNKKITTVMKNRNIDINKSIKSRAKTKPKMILSKIERKNKQIKQEVKLIQSAIDTNSIKSLSYLEKMVKSAKDSELISFQSLSKSNFTAIFHIKDQKDADQLDAIFKDSNDNVFVEADLANKQYKVSGSDE